MNEFNFDFSLDKLKQLIPNPYIEKWYETFVIILPQYEINTKERVCQFIAQTGHESLNFKILEENLNYSADGLRKTFPKYFPTTKLASEYSHKPEKIGNRVYANRNGNGDENSGDGWKYRGRGLIQTTFKNNYQAFGDSIELDLDLVPEYLMTFEGATQSAAYFWTVNNINIPSDKEDIIAVTKIINGGSNGLADRIARYRKAKQTL